MATPRELTFEDLTEIGSTVSPPSKDFLTSLIQFVDRAIILAKEITNLMNTAKTDLVPMITQKVMKQMPIPTTQNSEDLYNQIMNALNQVKTVFGDLKISELIQKMQENKELIIKALQIQGGGGREPSK